MKRLLLCLPALLFLSNPTWAAISDKSQQEEIIYRAYLGRADDVKLLLEQGAPANITNKEGVPLIALAATRTDPQAIPVIDALLGGGADINAKDTIGQTALFHAARINNEPMVMHLLNKGIDYYILDNNGDVARNIAHKEGFTKLVAAMDAFVVEQSKKVQKQYEDYNRTLQQRYEEQQRQLDEASYETEAQYQEALSEMGRIEAERQKIIAEKRAEPVFEENLQRLAYQMCGFQYWSYMRDTHQTTEIKADALNEAIDKHLSTMRELSRVLIEEYLLEKVYVDDIANRAQKRIFYEMDMMPSKTYRFQEGMGKLTDMDKRCLRVAKYWNVELTAEEQNPQLRKKRKNKGGGFGDEDYENEY